MLRSDKIYREFKFCVDVPSAELGYEETDEKIMVQGVIDCIIESNDGSLILCDYKTDRLPHDRVKAAAILRERHGNQLTYYAEACRALFGRAPDRICLWSLALGEAFWM